ncbi:unnamed protein product [Caenorhabditis angaria]|uniref:Uncharacterized protein n=1 Tax=Caenorhabditis angaria TaxID=860376 RepID=A0A9P1J774_9PELO|nr:unnamed protein product [Caenorhabditis angaria]
MEKTKESFQLCDFTEIGFIKHNRDKYITSEKKLEQSENGNKKQSRIFGTFKNAQSKLYKLMKIIEATKQNCNFKMFIEKFTSFENVTKIKNKTKSNMDDEKFTIFNYDLFCAAYDDYNCYTAWKTDQLYLDSRRV